MGSHLPFYKPSIVPGKYEGVTGTLPASFIASINNYIDDDNIRNAALNVLEFLTSKETQKDYILKKDVLSAMTKLYYDQEVCQTFSCDVFLQSRPFTKLSTRYKSLNYDKIWYSEKVRSYVSDYLYDRVSLDEAMSNIINLSKIYHFSLGIKDSSIGLIFFIAFIVLLCIMAVSVILISVKAGKEYAYFLPYNFWLISIFGTIVMMSSVFALYGTLTSLKCQLRIVLTSVGLSISLLPIFIHLIINFPNANKVSEWLKTIKNRYIFFVCSLGIVLLLNVLLSSSLYTVKNIRKIGDENFQTCKMESGFGLFGLIFLIVLKALLFIGMLLLVFFEWNIKETTDGVKVTAALLFIEVFGIILLITYFSFNFDNYKIYGFLFCGIVMLFSFSGFVFIYLIKLIPIIKKNKKEDIEDMIKQLRENNEKFLDSSVSKSEDIKSSNFTNNNDRTIKDSRDNSQINNHDEYNSKVQTAYAMSSVTQVVSTDSSNI